MLIILIVGYIIRLVTMLLGTMVVKTRRLSNRLEITLLFIFLANIAYLIGSISNGIRIGWEYSSAFSSIFLIISSLLQSISFLIVVVWIIKEKKE